MAQEVRNVLFHRQTRGCFLLIYFIIIIVIIIIFFGLTHDIHIYYYQIQTNQDY